MGVVLRETEKVVPQVNVCNAILGAQFFQAPVRLLQLLKHTVIDAWQDSLDVYLSRWRDPLQALHHYAGILYDIIDIAAAVLAQIVGSNHKKDLRGLSSCHSLNMLHRLANECPPHTAVKDVGFGAESLPPLVHIRYAVADKHYTFAVYRQNLEEVVLVCTERVCCKQTIGYK